MASTNTFTEGELKLLTNAWLCIDGGGIPKIDYEKLAAHTGFTKGSVGVMWGKVRRKIEGGAEVGGGSISPTKNATPKKRGAAVKDMDGTPQKKKKKKMVGGRKAKGEMRGEGGDDDDEGEVKMKMKNSGGEMKAEDEVEETIVKKEEGSGGSGFVEAESEDEV